MPTDGGIRCLIDIYGYISHACCRMDRNPCFFYYPKDPNPISQPVTLYILDMALLSITMLSIFIAFIGYFQPGPLAAIQPTYSVPQRLEEGFRKDHLLRSLGGILDKVWPIIHGNTSSMQPDTFLSPATVTVSNPIQTDPISETDFVLDKPNNLPEDTAEYAASDGYSVVLYDQGEHESDYPRTIIQRLGWISRTIGLTSILYPYSLFIKRHIHAMLLLGLPAVLIGVLFFAFSFWRDLQAADAEIMGFTDEIQVKKASLLHHIDLAAMIVDRELDGITSYIQMERGRVHDELDSFRPNDTIELEMNVFREKLETRLQDSFDRQVSWVRDFVNDIEQVRQGIPDLAEIRAQYEGLDNTLRRSKDTHGRLENALEQSQTALDLIGKRNSKLSSTSRGTASSTEEKLCSTCPSSSDEGTSQGNDKIEHESHVYSDSGSNGQNEEGQSKLVSEWVTASYRKKMSPEEFEKARKLRRERVEMRCASRKESHHRSLQSSQSVSNVGDQQPDLWASLDPW